MKLTTRVRWVAGLVLLSVLVMLLPDRVRAFINIPGLLVVFGGTLLATMVCRPVGVVLTIFREIPDLFRQKRQVLSLDVELLIRVSEHYRRGAIRNAETLLNDVTDSFVHAGLQLVLDQRPIEELDKLLTWRMDAMQQQEIARAHILRTMANFAPAFGMLGTLLGLVHMLHGLGNSGLDYIGSSMGFAMMTTLYGIVAANLVFKPLALKIERSLEQKSLHMGMLLEAIKLVYEKKHPVIIRETLDTYKLSYGASADVQSGQFKTVKVM